MNPINTLATLDQRHVWHPFTQMQDWLKHEPIVIVRGKGAQVQDSRGKTYLDANSSIWTNLHGHTHPRINTAIRRQLDRIAHSSALGLANEPASLLAERLIKAAALPSGPGQAMPQLAKVFFSDDGSTAVEAALKLAYEYARRSGLTNKPRFVSLGGAYHGDTVGAVSVGHIPLFHKAYSGLLFKADQVMSPYCYRCRFNKAKPERADARLYRKCKWECLDHLERRFRAQKRRGTPYAAFVFEPLIQGAAGMIAQPAGWLNSASKIARAHGTLLVADEVLTGFGRTGTAPAPVEPSRPSAVPGGWDVRKSSLFACHQEGVQPDLMALAKGLTGGYLPMAATLTSQSIFDAFLGEYSEFKTFFHGHSFTANQLGASAALESMKILQSATSGRARRQLERAMRFELERLWVRPQVGDIRQVGLIAAVELVKDSRTRQPFDAAEKVGIRICEAMAKRGVLTRPVGNVIVLMPPYCTSEEQIHTMVSALDASLGEFRKRLSQKN